MLEISSETLLNLGIVVASALGGVFTGYHLTVRNERQKESRDIEKIQYLLNAQLLKVPLLYALLL